MRHTAESPEKKLLLFGLRRTAKDVFNGAKQKDVEHVDLCWPGAIWKAQLEAVVSSCHILSFWRKA